MIGRTITRWSRPGACRPSRQRGITLIELLISMTVLAVITSMILMVWFALQNSFAYSVDASHQREAARDAVSRMSVTIRDAQSASFSYVTTGPVAVITKAEGSEIDFNTSYARSGNANILPNAGTSGNNNAVVQACFIYVPSDSNPSDGKIYYVVDTDNNGLSNELGVPGGTPVKGRIIVDHVVNNARPVGNPTSVFTYTYFGDTVNPLTNDNIYQAKSVTGANNMSRIYSVQIHVLVDLNPGHAPAYMDLQSTAQPRNMRPST